MTGSKILTVTEPEWIGIIFAGTGPEPEPDNKPEKLTGYSTGLTGSTRLARFLPNLKKAYHSTYK